MLQPDECYNLLFRPNSEQKTNEAPSDVNIMLDGSSTYPGCKIECFASGFFCIVKSRAMRSAGDGAHDLLNNWCLQ